MNTKATRRNRREVLQLAAAATLAGLGAAGCTSTGASTKTGPIDERSKPAPIAAVAFDLFTLFDPRGVDRRVAAILDGDARAAAFATTWKQKLFEYSWVYTAANRYRDFAALADDALAYAARVHAVELSSSARSAIASSLCELDPWPDTAHALAILRNAGLRLAPLANFTPAMIERLLARSGLRGSFDDVISTDRARTFKPDARAYALAEDTFGVSRRQIAFAAFGNWDAAGAHWFGFPTVWINRLGAGADALAAAADVTGDDLGALLRLASR